MTVMTPIAPGAVELGPWAGRYTPAYEIIYYREGYPHKRITGGFDQTSVVSITTNKNIENISGTWAIKYKDYRVWNAVKQMDVCVIRLKGHNSPLTTVLHGVVDSVEPESNASPESAEENMEVTGRCLGKYLQINSLFLPVWETSSLLPTVLTFGLGDPESKTSPIPREIFRYIFDRYVVGLSDKIGISGTPVAKNWVNPTKRFELVRARDGKPFSVPYIQFDEDTTDQVLTSLTVVGFTEAWVDEFGYVVYRPPGWDLPVNFILYTDGLISDKLTDTDVGMATYVEVVPTGALGIGSAQAQALLAGRAPVPSSYLSPNSRTHQGELNGVKVSPEYVIQSDAKGKVTKRGAQNYWYKQQRKYGLRPYQVTSPLLSSQAQAQDQAEGLLKFLGNRLQKSGKVTIPGESNIRLGTTILLKGSLRGKKIERTYFVEGVNHEYVDGQYYRTTLELSHGRDPWDPLWRSMVLPSATISLSELGGVLNTGTGEHGGSANLEPAQLIPGKTGKLLSGNVAAAPSEAPQAVQDIIAAGNTIHNLPYVYGGGHGGSLDEVASSYDCSSSVSFLLRGGGLFGERAQDSTELESYGESGPGKWVTIYANPEHTFLTVAGLVWDHGPGGWFASLSAAGQPTEGYVVRHPDGL